MKTQKNRNAVMETFPVVYDNTVNKLWENLAKLKFHIWMECIYVYFSLKFC